MYHLLLYCRYSSYGRSVLWYFFFCLGSIVTVKCISQINVCIYFLGRRCVVLGKACFMCFVCGPKTLMFPLSWVYKKPSADKHDIYILLSKAREGGSSVNGCVYWVQLTEWVDQLVRARFRKWLTRTH